MRNSDFSAHKINFDFQTPQSLPITFKIGTNVYRGMPKDSNVKTAHKDSITNTEYSAEIDGLTVSCIYTVYEDYPVCEWIVYLQNGTDKISDKVTDFYSADTDITGDEPVYEYSNGDSCNPGGYEIFYSSLDKPVTLRPRDGTPCCDAFPYMRINFKNSGVNLAVGYTAQWRSEISKNEQGVHFKAGQDVFNTVIYPGETMISPRITVMSYSGNEEYGRNLWRRWYMDYIIPDCGGEPIKPMLSLHNYGKGPESTCATEKSQITAIDAYVKNGLKPDFWWLDAGWYPCNHTWQYTGTWFENKLNFPNGLTPVGEHCDKLGIKFLLWFEPERVTKGSWLDRRHPEWVLYREDKEGLFGLLDLGNQKALDWATEYFDAFIKRCHIKIYRQDFNIAPLMNWRENETEDRMGALENLHVQGYYKFWDSLLERNPGLLLDSCASGGRRNDLETMRRSVAFHYTDVGYGDIPVKQKQHRLMHEWIPYFRSHTHSWDDENGEYHGRRKSVIDSFNYHNAMSPAITNLIEYNASEKNFALARLMDKIQKRAGEYMLHADYYPLSECRKDNRDYYAVQFDNNGVDGYVQIIANTKAVNPFTLKMKNINDEKIYCFENPENGEVKETSGEALIEGIVIQLPPRTGELWFYRTV